jgi:hypothetical protein
VPTLLKNVDAPDHFPEGLIFDTIISLYLHPT